MLDTSLKDVSALKDASSLLGWRRFGAAFWPSLVFWSLTALVALFLLGRDREALDGWKQLGGTEQGLIAFGALTWTIFFAALVQSAQNSIIRFWEGYPARTWLGSLTRFVPWPLFQMCQVAANRWYIIPKPGAGEKQPYDDHLFRIAAEAENYRSFKQSLAPDKYQPPQDAPPDVETAVRLLYAFLEDRLKKTRRWYQWPRNFPSPENQTKKKARKWKLKWSAFPLAEKAAEKIGNKLVKRKSRAGDLNLLETAQQGRDKRFAVEGLRAGIPPNGADQHQVNLKHLCDALDGLLERLKDEVVRRAELQHADLQRASELRYWQFPLPGEKPRPTVLGRILRTAEAYPGERYGLDAVLFWPRVIPLAPKEFRDDVSDAESALALLTTLTTFFLLFGLPLAIAAIWKWAMSSWWAWWLCWAGAPLAVCTAARLAYLGAVSAAHAYGSQIRTAFDLYRHDLLKALKLPLPSNPQEERQLWKLLTKWLYVGIDPEARLQFSDGEDKKALCEVEALVPVKKVEANSEVKKDNLVLRRFLPSQLPAGALKDRKLIEGKTVSRELPENVPILCWALAGLAETAAVAVSVSPAVFGALGLRPGDKVWVLLTTDAFPAVGDVVGPLNVLAVCPADTTRGDAVVVVSSSAPDAARVAAAVAAKRLTLIRCVS